VNGGDTIIVYQAKDGTGYTLLTANGGVAGPSSNVAGTGGTASTNNYFGASGIFTSIAGQDGSAGSSTGNANDVQVSTTTFLSAGAGGNGGVATGSNVSPNYGYPRSIPATTSTANPGEAGFFITQPILVGRGGSGGGTTTTAGGAGGNGGIGCGGGGSGEDANKGGTGGDGAVFIWSW
jgi:hypothetical protein